MEPQVMLSPAECQYHEERARTELDLAYRAEHKSVAEAHFRLSALHMERVRALAAGYPKLAPAQASEAVPRH
jgi:hypothetical protein